MQPLLGTYERIDNHMWNRTKMCPMVDGIGPHVAQGAGREVLFGKEVIGLTNLLDKRVKGAGGYRHLHRRPGQKIRTLGIRNKTKIPWVNGRTALIAQDTFGRAQRIIPARSPTDAARLSASVWQIRGCTDGKP